jgi:broad specificity phosphatase PhoE
MATFFLIRHASAHGTGRVLAGRSPGVHLTPEGQREAQQLAQRLAHARIHHLFCSPMERTRETAEPIGKALKLPVQISQPLIEVDFGDWTGRAIAELEPDEHWKQWNLFRSTRRIPNGEMLPEVQARMVREMERLATALPNDGIALVSHGEPIRTAVAHFLGISIDLQHRLELSPASLTILECTNWGARLMCFNTVE